VSWITCSRETTLEAENVGGLPTFPGPPPPSQLRSRKSKLNLCLGMALTVGCLASTIDIALAKPNATYKSTPTQPSTLCLISDSARARMSSSAGSFLATLPAAADSQGASSDSDEHATVQVLKEKPVLLKGNVAEDVSPIKTDGSKNEVPPGTPVSLVMAVNVNSEISKVGDDIVAMVSIDVKDHGKVILPGQWWVHGKVSEVEHQRRLGRDGYVSVKFDKLVSPDGKYQVPIEASASTKESTAKSVTKVVAKDSLMVTKGAVGGAITSVQLTGIPLAVATHGYSVAAGAAAGAGIGLIGALKRKGNIASSLRGEELKFNIDKPLILPAFNEQVLPSALAPSKVENLEIVVNKASFGPDPFGDKRSRVLFVGFKMDNKSDREYSFANLVVVSDHNQMYYPYALSTALKERNKRVPPNSIEEGTLSFDVDSPKRKYWLVLMDRGNCEELTRVPVN
jgi:hypothetical protein